MKKNKLIIILSICAIALIIIALLSIKKIEEPIIYNNDFIFIEEKYYDEKLDIDENYIFTNYDDFYKVFKSNKLTNEDFINNNYALIQIKYDACSEDNITPTNYTINDEIQVIVKYNSRCGFCQNTFLYYLLKLDKDIVDKKINVKYEVVKKEKCDPNVSYKPLIYLYPKEKQEITIQFIKPQKLTTTYPKYNNEWRVTVEPNGNIYDANGRHYYGLYWEGVNTIKSDFEDGFVVSRHELIPFLEEKLNILGLNEREANEFIIYWLPILEKNDYNLIRFADILEIEKEMPIMVTPTPDTMIRILMEYKPIDHYINIPEQSLSSPNRVGYTLVEWGGTLLK